MLRNALWKTGDTRNEVRTIWYDENFAGWEYRKAYFWNINYNADNGCMWFDNKNSNVKQNIVQSKLTIVSREAKKKRSNVTTE